MPVSRRTALTLLAVIAIGFATAGASGAFDKITLTRDVDVAVGADDTGYLQLEPHEARSDEGLRAEIGDDDLVRINLSRANLNNESRTKFNKLLNVTNRGSKPVTLEVAGLDVMKNELSWVTVTDAQGETDFGTIDPDETVEIGLLFEPSGPDVSDIVELEFKATAEE